MQTTLMPEKRPGQEVIRLFLPEELKQRFKRLCSIRGTTMTAEILRFIESEVEENQELVDLVERKLKKKE